MATETSTAETQGATLPQDHVPVLLLQLQDELARSRRREAFWISLLFHFALIVAIATLPPLFPDRGGLLVATPADLIREQEARFLALPPELYKPPTRRPETNILSDRDRIASSRQPRQERDELADGLRAGAPGLMAPPAQRPAPAAPPAAAQADPGQRSEQQPEQQAPPATDQTAPGDQVAILRPPRRGGEAGNRGFGGALSPGTAIEQAARAAAQGGAGGGSYGEFGLGRGSPAKVGSDLDILSDTMGVDFGPYLSRVIHQVRINWYSLIPEVARAPLMRRGKVSIEFAIMRDGSVAGMRLTSPSGDSSLDRAAWGGISGSNPFPPLPGQFGGDYLALRFHFYYNPERNELR